MVTYRKSRAVLFALIFSAPFFAAYAAPQASANSLRELFANLNRCISLAPGAPSGEVTIVFSLRRDGSLLGKPRVTYARLPRDQEEQRRLIENLAGAFGSCMPAPITNGLGDAIAGRPLAVRFVIGPRGSDI